jgi:hypothetical protein
LKFLLCTLFILSVIPAQASTRCDYSVESRPVGWDDLSLLQEISHWAMGGAFSTFAEQAGVVFDSQSFLEDCPDIGVFNFGRATATSCMDVDVLTSFISVAHVLQNYYSRSLQKSDTQDESSVNFQEYYLSKAVEWGFIDYITIP